MSLPRSVFLVKQGSPQPFIKTFTGLSFIDPDTFSLGDNVCECRSFLRRVCYLFTYPYEHKIVLK